MNEPDRQPQPPGATPHSFAPTDAHSRCPNWQLDLRTPDRSVDPAGAFELILVATPEGLERTVMPIERRPRPGALIEALVAVMDAVMECPMRLETTRGDLADAFTDAFPWLEVALTGGVPGVATVWAEFLDAPMALSQRPLTGAPFEAESLCDAMAIIDLNPPWEWLDDHHLFEIRVDTGPPRFAMITGASPDQLRGIGFYADAAAFRPPDDDDGEPDPPAASLWAVFDPPEESTPRRARLYAIHELQMSPAGLPLFYRVGPDAPPDHRVALATREECGDLHLALRAMARALPTLRKQAPDGFEALSWAGRCLGRDVEIQSRPDLRALARSPDAGPELPLGSPPIVDVLYETDHLFGVAQVPGPFLEAAGEVSRLLGPAPLSGLGDPCPGVVIRAHDGDAAMIADGLADVDSLSVRGVGEGRGLLLAWCGEELIGFIGVLEGVELERVTAGARVALFVAGGGVGAPDAPIDPQVVHLISALPVGGDDGDGSG